MRKKNVFVVVNSIKIYSFVIDLANKLANIHYYKQTFNIMGTMLPSPCVGPITVRRYTFELTKNMLFIRINVPNFMGVLPCMVFVSYKKIYTLSAILGFSTLSAL